MIIVEGIDRVGKTTLVNLLKESTNIPVLNDTYLYETSNMREDKRVNVEKIKTIVNFARDVSDKFIVDRLHWSEMIYGCCDRKYNNVIPVLDIEEELIKLGAKIILVVPTDLEESTRQHGNDLSEHSRLFDVMFDGSKMKKFKCDYNTLSDAVRWVIENE